MSRAEDFSWVKIAGLSLLLSLPLNLPGVIATRNDAAPADGGLGATKKPALSNDEMISQAQAIQKRGVQLAERLSKMLSEARRDKDILRVNCLNRKLTEANATSDTVGQRVSDLESAAAGNDEGRTNHEFTVLTVLASKFNSLDQEAAGCLGQDVYESGATQIVSTIAVGTTTPTPNPNPDTPDFYGPPTAPGPPVKATATATPSARDEQVKQLQAAGLLGSGTGPFTDKQVKDGQNTLKRLTQERIDQLKKDVTASESQVRLRVTAQNSADAGKQKADAFLGKNWIDRNGYVVQLDSKVLRPDNKTVTKVDYTYRGEGPLAGTSVFSNRVSFNKALPEDWTVVYSRGLNDAANLGGGSPDYWRTLQQVSAFSPGTAGCLVCFSKQYVDPSALGGGLWGQPYTYSIGFNGASGAVLPGNQLVQYFAADGSLVAGSPTLSFAPYLGGSWKLAYDSGSGETQFLTLEVISLSDLGRNTLTLRSLQFTWDALRRLVRASASGSYIELTLSPIGSSNSVDVLLSPAAFLEAF